MQENYTPRQIAAIQNAIGRGRQSLMQCDEHPRIFANAFIRAEGLQLPGEDLDRETRRRMEIHIMAAINERHSEIEEEPRISAAIHREITRILGESERFQMMKNPYLVGYHLVIDDQVADKCCCKYFTSIDVFGLGPGVVPPHEIVVLPPCCDGIQWKPVYETEKGEKSKKGAGDN